MAEVDRGGLTTTGPYFQPRGVPPAMVDSKASPYSPLAQLRRLEEEQAEAERRKQDEAFIALNQRLAKGAEKPLVAGPGKSVQEVLGISANALLSVPTDFVDIGLGLVDVGRAMFGALPKDEMIFDDSDNPLTRWRVNTFEPATGVGEIVSPIVRLGVGMALFGKAAKVGLKVAGAPLAKGLFGSGRVASATGPGAAVAGYLQKANNIVQRLLNTRRGAPIAAAGKTASKGARGFASTFNKVDDILRTPIAQKAAGIRTGEYAVGGMMREYAKGVGSALWAYTGNPNIAKAVKVKTIGQTLVWGAVVDFLAAGEGDPLLDETMADAIESYFPGFARSTMSLLLTSYQDNALQIKAKAAVEGLLMGAVLQTLMDGFAIAKAARQFSKANWSEQIELVKRLNDAEFTSFGKWALRDLTRTGGGPIVLRDVVPPGEGPAGRPLRTTTETGGRIRSGNMTFRRNYVNRRNQRISVDAQGNEYMQVRDPQTGAEYSIPVEEIQERTRQAKREAEVAGVAEQVAARNEEKAVQEAVEQALEARRKAEVAAGGEVPVVRRDVQARQQGLLPGGESPIDFGDGPNLQTLNDTVNAARQAGEAANNLNWRMTEGGAVFDQPGAITPAGRGDVVSEAIQEVGVTDLGNQRVLPPGYRGLPGGRTPQLSGEPPSNAPQLPGGPDVVPANVQDLGPAPRPQLGPYTPGGELAPDQLNREFAQRGGPEIVIPYAEPEPTVTRQTFQRGLEQTIREYFEGNDIEMIQDITGVYKTVEDLIKDMMPRTRADMVEYIRQNAPLRGVTHSLHAADNIWWGYTLRVALLEGWAELDPNTFGVRFNRSIAFQLDDADRAGAVARARAVADDVAQQAQRTRPQVEPQQIEDPWSAPAAPRPVEEVQVRDLGEPQRPQLPEGAAPMPEEPDVGVLEAQRDARRAAERAASVQQEEATRIAPQLQGAASEYTDQQIVRAMLGLELDEMPEPLIRKAGRRYEVFDAEGEFIAGAQKRSAAEKIARQETARRRNALVERARTMAEDSQFQDYEIGTSVVPEPSPTIRTSVEFTASQVRALASLPQMQRVAQALAQGGTLPRKIRAELNMQDIDAMIRGLDNMIQSGDIDATTRRVLRNAQTKLRESLSELSPEARAQKFADDIATQARELLDKGEFCNWADF